MWIADLGKQTTEDRGQTTATERQTRRRAGTSALLNISNPKAAIRNDLALYPMLYALGAMRWP
jgi:hypothetical protein